MARLQVLIVFFLLSSLAAGQTKLKLSHHLRENAVPVHFQSNQSVPVNTVRILGIMAEFQTDNNDKTTGDGKFQLTGSQNQIDPPPHDSLYFINKIRFVENYFHKVSNGILTISGDLLRQKIVLSKQMSEYSPPISKIDNRKLAELAGESWTAAAAQNPEISFSDYDVFVIFHAGAGRDIDMISTTGINPTPYDIPSLYMDSSAIAAALGVSMFNGFANGAVKNTIILPESESRDVSGILLQLSINGLFAASVGSFLGLPDLFDTKTGLSGIGQFGLMDGAGFFAYNGLFPPEPCAWEKIFLGWVTPQVVQNSTSLTMQAVGLTTTGQDVVYKIPINNSEYFLLENRSRDPEGNGQKLTIVKNGTETIQYIPDDPSAFIYYDTTGISGSVIDAEDFDWALPSWEDTLRVTRYYGGGILIWHIDDDVIRSGIKTNSINTNLDHRGVSLVEADGSKDIGQDYVSGQDYAYGTQYGIPFDCWYSENKAALYKNIFDHNSIPNSDSYSKAASLITIKNFSPMSPVMSVSVEFGNNILNKDLLLQNTFTSIKDFPTSTKDHLFIPASDGLYAFRNDGIGLASGANPILSNNSPDFSVAAYKMPDNTEIVASLRDSVLEIIELFNGSMAPRFPKITINAAINERFSAPPSIIYSDSLYIFAGTESGSLLKFNLGGKVVSMRSTSGGPVASIAWLPASLNSYEYYFTAGDRIYTGDDSVDLPSSANGWLLTAAVSSQKGNFIVALEKNGSRIISFDRSLNKNFEITNLNPGIQQAAMADIDGDGEKDIIIQSSAKLSVLNRSGSMLDGFPFPAASGREFTGTPLIADFNNDGKPEIILLTSDGNMWVYNNAGRLLDGFPVQAAVNGIAFPALYSSPDPSSKLGIAVLSSSGSLNAFLANNSVSGREFYWYQYLGNENHMNSDTIVTVITPVSSEFFPKSRVYNWPNPVYGSSTHIRYYTSENADITVTVLDIAGAKITELKGRGTAGMDNEITWDVSRIQSGVYLARIEARGASQNQVAIIKIAVVK